MPAAYSGHVLPGEQPATAAGEGGKAPAADEPASGKAESTASASDPEGGKLKPNELNPLVLGFLEVNKDDGPYGPGQVAKALQRSSGAVGNCLERLAKDKKVKRVVDKPRRYSIA
jgi:hypothetical protein